MKKLNILSLIGLTTISVIPLQPLLTSCSTKDYSELVSRFQDATISQFINISHTTHRNVWNEGEIYTYIKKQMQSMGFTEPSGYDKWSEVTAVKYYRDIEKQKLLDNYGEKDFGEYGNIWYDISATSGYENAPKIILNCHMDSQMEFKNDDEHKRWAKDYDGTSTGGGIIVNYDLDNDIMSSEGHATSIGADGGIGVATMLTIAKYRNEFKHGGIRLLFTAGESEAIAERYDVAKDITRPEYASGFSFLEVDQGGGIPADEPGKSYLGQGSTKPFGAKGEFKNIISLSGITSNAISVSSSGVHECAVHEPVVGSIKLDSTDNVINWTHKDESQQDVNNHFLKIDVSGLYGGSSSTYINKGFANALNLLYTVLYTGDRSIQLINATSNEASVYSICTEASATFVSQYSKETFEAKISANMSLFKNFYPGENWNNVKIKVTETEITEALKSQYKRALSWSQSRSIIKLLAKDLYYGPLDWFDSNYKEVKTSENFGPFNLVINQGSEPTTPATIEDFDLHCAIRSSDKKQIAQFYSITHAAFVDDLDPLFSAWEKSGITLDWTEYCVQHISNPTWEPSNNNKMGDVLKKCFSNFSINANIVNEHSWLEIACVPNIYYAIEYDEPNIALIGPQINNNHSVKENLYTDTLGNNFIGVFLYLFDNCGSLLS